MVTGHRNEALISFCQRSHVFARSSCIYRVRTAQEKPGKRDFFEKNQGKPGKLREFSDHFYSLKENSGNFVLPNISDQIGGALRINEASK